VVFLKTSVSVGLAVIVMSAHAGAQEMPEPAKERRGKPPDCASLPEKTRRATEICKTEEERREDDYQKRVAERLEREKPTKTSFLKWLHVDGLWAPTTMEGGTFGLVGTHVTIADIGRVNLFGPPGVMLLIEDHGGGRTIRPAITWGISVYLVDFHPPGTTNTARLFLNLAKAQTFGDQRTGMDLAGLSITWRK
jgi:hypothetical protein